MEKAHVSSPPSNLSPPAIFPIFPTSVMGNWLRPAAVSLLSSHSVLLLLQEAASLISQRAVNPRDMFKQRERGIPPSDSEAAPPSPHPGTPTPPPHLPTSPLSHWFPLACVFHLTASRCTFPPSQS